MTTIFTISHGLLQCDLDIPFIELWGLYHILLDPSGLGTHLWPIKCRSDFWSRVIKGHAAFPLFPGNLTFRVLPRWGHHAVRKPKLVHMERPHGGTLRLHEESKREVPGQPALTALPQLHPSADCNQGPRLQPQDQSSWALPGFLSHRSPRR